MTKHWFNHSKLICSVCGKESKYIHRVFDISQRVPVKINHECNACKAKKMAEKKIVLKFIKLTELQ
jgi:hypothetical protein